MTLDLMRGSYAICRLDATAAVPSWATRPGFSSITRTADELSIVCATEAVPDGIVASLAGALAAAAISIFVVSTHDTDYLFVRDADLERAVAVLRDAGHAVAIDV